MASYRYSRGDSRHLALMGGSSVREGDGKRRHGLAKAALYEPPVLQQRRWLYGGMEN